MAGSANVEARSPAAVPADQAKGIARPSPPISSGSAPVFVTLTTRRSVALGPRSHSRTIVNVGAAGPPTSVRLARQGSLEQTVLPSGLAPALRHADHPAPAPAGRARMLASPRPTCPWALVKLKPSAPAAPDSPSPAAV